MNKIVSLAVFTGVIGLAAHARGETTSGSTHYAPTWGSSAPAKPAPAGRPIEETDHDDTRLRPGVGYFGRLAAPLGQAGARADGGSVPVHTIGVRYWFRRRVGLDVAIGLNTNTAWTDSATEPSTFAIGARTSLPFSLFISEHLTLFVAPTLAYVQAAESIPGQPGISPITGLARTPPRTRHGGMQVSLGARVGAELHFGFIAATRLAISASVGIDGAFSRVWTSAAAPPSSRDPEPAVTETTASRLSIRTSFNDGAAAAVLGNLAVLCYF